MYSCGSTVRIEKKLAPFVDLNGKMVIEIDNISTGQAVIYLPLKNGVSPEMLEAVGVVMLQADLSSASSGQFMDSRSEAVQEKRPVLPFVQNEYDDIRGKIGTDLGPPVSTLFVGNERVAPSPSVAKVAQTVPVERAAPAPTQRAPAPIPQPPVVEKPIQPVLEPEQESAPAAKSDGQVEVMQRQMEMMMKQMVAMQELLTSKSSKGEIVVPSERKPERKKIDTIMTAKEFYETLDSIKAEMPKFDEGRRLTREESQMLERYRLPKPAYVVSNGLGQLFINDVGITIRQSTAANLAGIAVYKLKQSGDLKMCFDTGKLKFVSAELATKMSETAGIHAAMEGVESGLKAFVGADGKAIEQAERTETDVTGTVDDSPVTSEDIIRRNSGRARQVSSIEEVDETVPDEQSQLYDLTGGGGEEDEVSAAARASARSHAQARAAIRHKAISRLDD